MLKPLIRKKSIVVWDDTTIQSGDRWRERIEQALAAAKVAVLLVSPNFLASDFIAEHELPPILEASKKEGLVILWIYITSCLYEETEIKDYQAAHDISKPLKGLGLAELDSVLAEICRKVKIAGVLQMTPDATPTRSGLRPADSRRSDFLAIATRLSEQVDGSYLQHCWLQVQQGLLEAECGATFALTMGNRTDQQTLDLISNGIKGFQLTLSDDVKQMTLSLAQIAQAYDTDQIEDLTNIVRGLVPSVLCAWILLHGLRIKDVPLLKAAHALAIDSLAIGSFSLRIPHKEKLEDLAKALRHLFDGSREQMSGDVVILWLGESTLSRIASQGNSDPSIWAQRYDATCPSEFYRGYASLLTQIGEALKPSSSPATLHHLIEVFDLEIRGLPADERRNGANFALMNVAAYAQAGTVPQVSATVAAELVCIARCFVHNQARGI